MSGIHMMLLGLGASLIKDFGGDLVAEDLTSPYTDSATLTLNSTGTITKTGGPTVTANTIGSAWLGDGGTASIWSVRATVVGGGVTSGTTGSWLALTSNRAWNVANNAIATLDLAFSNDGGTTTHKTVRVFLSATNLM